MTVVSVEGESDRIALHEGALTRRSMPWRMKAPSLMLRSAHAGRKSTKSVSRRSFHRTAGLSASR